MNAPETIVADPNLNFFVLFTGEAASELGIAPSTMRRWARAGRIPYVADHNGWRLFGVGDVYALRDAIREENR